MESYFKCIDCFTKYVRIYKSCSYGKIICVLLEDFYKKKMSNSFRTAICADLKIVVLYMYCR